MSNWDERVQKIVQTVEHDPDTTCGLGYADGYADGGHEMARWQRKALMSDEGVERAMLGIHASHDRGDWDEELPVVQAEYRDMARAALTAALGEGEV